MKELLFKESGRKVYYNKIFSFDDDCDWVLEVGRTKSLEKVIGYGNTAQNRCTKEGTEVK